MNRRGFLAGILASGVAPAAVGSSILMPVRKLVAPQWIGVDLALKIDEAGVVGGFGAILVPADPARYARQALADYMDRINYEMLVRAGVARRV